MSFHFMGHYIDYDGYGYATIKITEALQAAGACVDPVDMCVDGWFGDFDEEEWHLDRPALVMTVPEWWPAIHTSHLVGFTMFEATRFPDDRVVLINEHADRCLTPCEWVKDVFRDSGVRVPISVVKFGIDPADYYPLGREDHDGPYTFLWSGTPDMRKGWDLAYKAFIRAFGSKNKNVRLFLHFRKMPAGVLGFADENVHAIHGTLGQDRVQALLKAADCYVFPTRGEGWGLPPREAAATGLPVICTRWSGTAVEIDNWALPLEVSGYSPAAFGWWDRGEVGNWADPDEDQLVEHMRWCFKNPDAAARIGREAARWLAENATWERTAKRIMDVMEGC